jgi:hypothetical protein
MIISGFELVPSIVQANARHSRGAIGMFIALPRSASPSAHADPRETGMETTPQTEHKNPDDQVMEPATETSLGERLREANRRARAFIEAQPLACFVGALAGGFLVGRLMREKR